MQAGERRIMDIKRHPIGILITYVLCCLVLVGIGVITLLGLPTISDLTGSQVDQIAGVSLFIFAVICAVYSLIATKVYWGNTWILTSDSITQITQTGLFTRQSSQLSLEDIEDVTAEQNGIFTHIFNYGLIRVETAGEHSRYTFVFCPNPNYYAQQILRAREDHILHASGHATGPHPAAPPSTHGIINTPPPNI